MFIILHLPLCLDKLKRSVICVDDHLLPQNVILPLSTCMHNGIHLFIMGGVFLNGIGKCLIVISHRIPLLGENDTNIIVRSIYLNSNSCCRFENVNTCAVKSQCFNLTNTFCWDSDQENFFFHSTLGNLNQRPSNMRGSQHEPLIKIGKGKELQSYVRVVRDGQSQMNWVLYRSTCIPFSSTMYPIYWTWIISNVHFSKLEHSLYCYRV